MQCITTSSLSFLVNGAPYGVLKPSRGIRQGDPLSLFLFVIYIEIISRFLAEQENLGIPKGVKISRTSPAVSHLLYVDDLIIYCGSIDEDALCIKNIIEKYSLWSSQSPNTNKSSIHFSSNTYPNQKLSILRIHNFKECNHKDKHLGFPFCKPISKKIVFNQLIDRINSKLSGWRNKTLSQAGRSILISDVASAIPTYQMSITLFPKMTCSNLMLLLESFGGVLMVMKIISFQNVGIEIANLKLPGVLVLKE